MTFLKRNDRDLCLRVRLTRRTSNAEKNSNPKTVESVLQVDHDNDGAATLVSTLHQFIHRNIMMNATSTAAIVAAPTSSPTMAAASSCANYYSSSMLMNNDSDDDQEQNGSNSSSSSTATAAHKAANNTKTMMIISTAEAMNPSRRNTMEDRHIILAPGSWGAPDPDIAFLAVCDGHGGKSIQGLSYFFT
jgi:hypothetical protein